MRREEALQKSVEEAVGVSHHTVCSANSIILISQLLIQYIHIPYVMFWLQHEDLEITQYEQVKSHTSCLCVYH